MSSKSLWSSKRCTKLGKDLVEVNVNLEKPGRMARPAAEFVQTQLRADRQLIVAGRVGDAWGYAPIGRGGAGSLEAPCHLLVVELVEEDQRPQGRIGPKSDPGPDR